MFSDHCTQAPSEPHSFCNVAHTHRRTVLGVEIFRSIASVDCSESATGRPKRSPYNITQSNRAAVLLVAFDMSCYYLDIPGCLCFTEAWMHRRVWVAEMGVSAPRWMRPKSYRAPPQTVLLDLPSSIWSRRAILFDGGMRHGT